MSQLDAAPGDDAVRHTAAQLGWSSPDPRPAALAICAAAVAVVLEAWYFLLDAPPLLRVGHIPVSPSIVPVTVIIVVGGGRLLGRARSSDSAKTFWVLTPMVLAVVTISIDDVGLASAAGFVLAAFSEELVYRVAGPAVVAFGLARAGMPHGHALTVGYVVAGTTFVILPGHVAQWDEVAYVAPFIAFTVLATLAVHRSGAILEIGVLHSAVNIVSVGRLTGAIGTSGAVLVGALLGLLVIGYIPASGRREDVIIDLTGDEPSVVTGEDRWTLAEPAGSSDPAVTMRGQARTQRARSDPGFLPVGGHMARDRKSRIQR